MCPALGLLLVVLVIIPVYGNTAMVGDGPGHGSHASDDARSRVVTQNGVCCFTIFFPAAEDKDLAVTHRHATALQFAEGVNDMHPVILFGVIAEDGLGQAPTHVDDIVQRDGGDAAFSDWYVSPKQPCIRLRIIALDLV